jgi:hypothetical protein
MAKSPQTLEPLSAHPRYRAAKEKSDAAQARKIEALGALKELEEEIVPDRRRLGPPSVVFVDRALSDAQKRVNQACAVAIDAARELERVRLEVAGELWGKLRGEFAARLNDLAAVFDAAHDKATALRAWLQQVQSMGYDPPFMAVGAWLQRVDAALREHKALAQQMAQ